MGLIKKVEDNLLVLNDINQKESKIYLEEVEKIERVMQQLVHKKNIAGKEISRLEAEIVELEREYIFETDPSKIKEVAEKKRNIRFDIEENKSIQNTKYNPYIKEMLAKLGSLKAKAFTEIDKFNRMVMEKENQYQEEIRLFNEEINKKIEELNTVRLSHLYHRANRKYTSMQMDKGSW